MKKIDFKSGKIKQTGSRDRQQTRKNNREKQQKQSKLTAVSRQKGLGKICALTHTTPPTTVLISGRPLARANLA